MLNSILSTGWLSTRIAAASHHCKVLMALAIPELAPFGAGMRGIPLGNSRAAVRNTLRKLALSYFLRLRAISLTADDLGKSIRLTCQIEPTKFILRGAFSGALRLLNAIAPSRPAKKQRSQQIIALTLV